MRIYRLIKETEGYKKEDTLWAPLNSDETKDANKLYAHAGMSSNGPLGFHGMFPFWNGINHVGDTLLLWKLIDELDWKTCDKPTENFVDEFNREMPSPKAGRWLFNNINLEKFSNGFPDLNRELIRQL